MSEWKERTIDDVCTVTDCLHKTAPSVDKQTPYKMLRTVNIRNGRVLRENIKYVTKETYEKWSVRGYLKRNDIILTREAPMGEAAIIKSNEKFFLGQRMLQIEADTTKIMPDFLYYSFLAPYLQDQIKKHEGTGSVVSNIRIPELKNMKILLPSFKEQKNIISILRSIDDKIELNLQMNETLEEMAMTLYKHWFVDFGPFQDGEFVESELGMIPKGWEVIELQDIIDIKHGYAFKSNQFSDERNKNILVRMGNFRNKPGLQFSNKTKYLIDENVSEKYKLNSGDLVVVMSDVTQDGRILGRAGFIPKDNNVYWLNQRVVKIVAENTYKYFLYNLFNSSLFRNHCISSANSTTALNIKNDHLKKYKVALPQKKFYISLTQL